MRARHGQVQSAVVQVRVVKPACCVAAVLRRHPFFLRMEVYAQVKSGTRAGCVRGNDGSGLGRRIGVDASRETHRSGARVRQPRDCNGVAGRIAAHHALNNSSPHGSLGSNGALASDAPSPVAPPRPACTHLGSVGWSIPRALQACYSACSSEGGHGAVAGGSLARMHPPQAPSHPPPPMPWWRAGAWRVVRDPRPLCCPPAGPCSTSMRSRCSGPR